MTSEEGPLLTSEQQRQIRKSLEEKGALRACPRCGAESWGIIPGIAVPVLTGEAGVVALDGQSIPSVIALCTNCGFLSNHAIGVLGIDIQGEAVGADPFLDQAESEDAHDD